MTLGRVRGAVMLGQPLSVFVNIEPGAGEDVSAACLDAKVLYGETLQPYDQVTVSSVPGPNRTVVTQIYAHTIVSEPVVNVELMAGCGQKTSRQYVLFADLASETGAQTMALRPRVPALDANLINDLPPKTSAWDIPAKPPARKVPKAGGVVVLPVPEEIRAPAAAPKAKPAKTAKTATTAKADSDSKLKLTTPLPAPERKPELKASTQLPAAPVEDLQKRVDAIAEWKSLTMTPEEVQKNEERVKSLESDLKALQAVTLKNQQNVQLLTGALEKAESERYSNPLVYALVALLAGVLAVSAYIVSKSRSLSAKAKPWWGGAESQVAPSLPVQSAPPKAVLPANPPAPVARIDDLPKPLTAGSLPQTNRAASVIDVDIALGESVFADMQTTALAVPQNQPAPEVKRNDKLDFAPSGPASLRAINTREMLDVRQQAEFFMALGQHDEAVKVLESSVNESNEANPLVYLDLLKLLHTLSRRSEFERYRDEFNLQFTGLVPSYTHFLMEGNGLETYADICNQIVALWPSEDALEYIEMCLVRQPHDEPGQGFDLDAFRDLLTLHGVLRRLDAALDSALVPFSASRLSGASQLGRFAGAATAYDEQMDIATAPLPPIPHTEPDVVGAESVDLELTITPSNLMDFDVEGLKLPAKPGAPQT